MVCFAPLIEEAFYYMHARSRSEVGYSLLDLCFVLKASASSWYQVLLALTRLLGQSARTCHVLVKGACMGHHRRLRSIVFDTWPARGRSNQIRKLLMIPRTLVIFFYNLVRYDVIIHCITASILRL